MAGPYDDVVGSYDGMARSYADVVGSYDGMVGSYADMAGMSWHTGGSWMVESFLDTWHLGGEWIGDMWPKPRSPCVTWALDKTYVVDRNRPCDLREGV